MNMWFAERSLRSTTTIVTRINVLMPLKKHFVPTDNFRDCSSSMGRLQWRGDHEKSNLSPFNSESLVMDI